MGCTPTSLAICDAVLASLFNQDYQGEFSIILIDDQSSDDTGKVAQKIADKSHKSEQITIISGQPLEIGWTGKLWATRPRCHPVPP